MVVKIQACWGISSSFVKCFMTLDRRIHLQQELDAIRARLHWKVADQTAIHSRV